VNELDPHMSWALYTGCQESCQVLCDTKSTRGVIPSVARNLALIHSSTCAIGHLELRSTSAQSEIPLYARNDTPRGGHTASAARAFTFVVPKLQDVVAAHFLRCWSKKSAAPSGLHATQRVDRKRFA